MPATFEAVAPALPAVRDPTTGEVLDLKAAIAQGCSEVDASNYDVTATRWVGEDGRDGTTVKKFEVSGNDYRVQIFVLNPLDSSLMARSEEIRKDGVSYVRTTKDGYPETWAEWEIKTSFYTLLGPCPAPHNIPEDPHIVERVGPRHFVLGRELEGLKWELWLDENGVILQELQWFEDFERLGVTYSDIGVPNTITTPEPTPTPTPTPTTEPTVAPVPMAEDPAPSFTFTLFQGQDILGEGPLTPGDLQGKPLVIHFWAGLCPPCRAELPDFQEFYDEFGDRVNLVGVDVGHFTGLGSSLDAKDLLGELDITYPVASTADNSVMSDYRILGMPATTFIAADGSIFKHWQGAINLNVLREQTLAMLGELAPKSENQEPDS